MPPCRQEKDTDITDSSLAKQPKKSSSWKNSLKEKKLVKTSWFQIDWREAAAAARLAARAEGQLTNGQIFMKVMALQGNFSKDGYYQIIRTELGLKKKVKS